MRIKGVRKDKKNYGEIVELSANEKAASILDEAVAKAEEEKGFRTHLKGVSIEHLTQASNGKKLKDRYENNLYKADGTAMAVRLRFSTGALLEPKKIQFKIEFQDILTANGIPDLKVIKFEYTGL